MSYGADSMATMGIETIACFPSCSLLLSSFPRAWTHFLFPCFQDLPEQPYLQPPLSILVIERRAFGRTVLVGSHIVPHMLRFTLQGQEDPREEERTEEETRGLVPQGLQG